jgi:hypothetical protein
MALSFWLSPLVQFPCHSIFVDISEGVYDVMELRKASKLCGELLGTALIVAFSLI